MTKKHYEAIAAIIASTYNNAKLYPTAAEKHCEILEITASRLADDFQTDNKNFDRARFLAACGIEQSECPNGGDHRWHKPYINEKTEKCTMCDKIK